MTKELLQQALIKWYDSGAENRDEFIALIEQALAQQEQPVIEQSILDYTKGIYDYLQSTAPAGTADEAFRLPPTPSRNQRQIQDFAQGHSLGLVLQATGQDCGNGEQTGEHVEQPATPEDMKIYKDIADGYRRDVAQQEQPSDSEYARGFADGQKEFAEIAGGAWQTAVTDQLVIHHIYQAVHDTDPRKAVHDLLYISNDIALDPQVSSDAQALVDRGRREAQQEQPANRVYFVATGEVYDGQETYTRHDTPPPLSEFEILFSTAQPAQEASATWTEMVVANLVREGVNKHRARELAAHFLTLPTQPALSDDEILNCFYASKSEGMASYMLAVGRAIEAHCRGGQA